MSSFIPLNRDQAFLMPRDLRSWLPQNNLAHFVVAAVERVPLASFEVPRRTGRKPQHHWRLMLALLIHCNANGVFSCWRIERVICQDVAVRFVAATVRDFISGSVTALAPDAVTLSGNSLDMSVAAALLPSIGFAADR